MSDPGGDEGNAREILERLKAGDRSVSLASDERARLVRSAQRLDDADAAEILGDMESYQANSITDLLPHYRATQSMTRAARRAISDGVLERREVWDLADYHSRVQQPSQTRPVIVFVHEGWTRASIELWDRLRAALGPKGDATDLACVDLLEPMNVELRSRLAPSGVRLPYACFEVRGHPDVRLDLLAADNLAGALVVAARDAEQHVIAPAAPQQAHRKDQRAVTFKDVTTATFMAGPRSSIPTKGASSPARISPAP
jgi:hypothetical protein